MNILPLILTFLAIFSTLSIGFLRGQKASIVAERCATRFYNTNRGLLKSIAERRYDKIKSDTPPKPDKKKKKKKQIKSLPPPPIPLKRENRPPLDTSKLNLTPLFETKTDPKRHPLYEIAAELLRILYRDKLLKEGEEWEYALLDSFCAAKNPQELIDLYPTKTTLQPLFYKMLRGTHHYQLDIHQGIAPLEHFFILGKQSAIHFCFASPPLLEATFGKKIAAKIRAEEKKLAKPLTQDEFTALLTGDPACSALIAELDTQLNFTKKHPKRKTLSITDPKSDLLITKPLGAVKQ